MTTPETPAHIPHGTELLRKIVAKEFAALPERWSKVELIQRLLDIFHTEYPEDLAGAMVAAETQFVSGLVNECIAKSRAAKSIWVRNPTANLRTTNIAHTGTIGDAHFSAGKRGFYAKLKSLTREELIVMSDAEEATAQGALRDVKFKRAVASRLPEGGVVADYLSEEDLEEISRTLDD